MSFIIAKKELRTILFFSDTKVSIINSDTTITGGHKIRINPMFGILKSYILSPTLCINFAGNVENCINIIRNCNLQKAYEVQKYLQTSLLEINDHNSEFLVGISENTNTTYLYKVNSSKIELGETFWTGEKQAFEEYQSYYLAEHNFNENKFTQTSRAFLEVINKTNIATVGDFLVETVYEVDKNAFMYVDRLSSYTGYEKTHIPAGETTAIDIEGSPEAGAYMVSNLVSKDPIKPAVAIYFQHANFGILFTPEICLNSNGCGQVFSNIKISHFILRVQKEYKIKLQGFAIINGSLVNI